VKKEKKEKLPEQGNESPFQRFERLTKKVLATPKNPANAHQKEKQRT
jgi:hypothetical protein